MIEVKDLVKHYGPKKAVQGISFKVDEGEVVGFLGPNGAGKTTTMNIITGYLSATSGAAMINGMDILEDPLTAKKYIGYLPEQPPLYWDMTVKEYLNFVYNLKKAGEKSSCANRISHISAICELVGITHVYNRMTRNLSKGYRQRVGLAQSLIGDPEVLILDEPTVGLDPIQIVEMRNVIKDLGKKRTVILSSHILPEVQAVCERILLINEGLLIADDTPENLTRSTAADRRLLLRVSGENSAAVLSALRAVDGMSRVELQGAKEPGSLDYIIEAKPNIDIRKPVFHALEDIGCPILMLSPMGASLEDIFLRLTAKKDGNADEAKREG